MVPKAEEDPLLVATMTDDDSEMARLTTLPLVECQHRRMEGGPKLTWKLTHWRPRGLQASAAATAHCAASW